MPTASIPSGVTEREYLLGRPSGGPINAFLTAFNTQTADSGIRWQDLLVITLWGLGSLAAVVRLFRWTPSSG